MRKLPLFLLLLVFVAGAAGAAPWYVQIGDPDGFGFRGIDGPDLTTGAYTGDGGGPGNAWTGAVFPMVNSVAAPADTDADGILEIEDTGGPVIAALKAIGVPVGVSGKEFLPDVTSDGRVNSTSVDNWDNRSAAEIGGAAVTAANGATDTGSAGSQWTDITISQTYASASNSVDPFRFAFPDASAAVPNNATFSYSFDLVKGTGYEGPVAFALIFGDYDVSPAQVQIQGPNIAGTKIIPLAPQDNAAGEDGLIQLASLVLPFNEVFSDAGTHWTGSLTMVMLDAMNEPYYAIDTVAVVGTISGIPEPGTYALFGLGALGLLAWRRRRTA